MDWLRGTVASTIALICPLAAQDTVSVSPGELLDALRDARQGQTLRLLAGIHTGPIEISTAITLTGEDGAVIEGPGRDTVVTVTADDSRLENLTVRGSGDQVGSDDAVVLIRQVHGVTVSGCTIEARAFGIYLMAGGDHTVVDNRIIGDTTLAANRRGNGIHLWHSVRNEVVGNETSGTRDGIYLSFAHENEIRDNTGTELRYGIHYMYSERNQLQGNRFSRCTGGIALMFSLGNHIEGNHTDENRDFGILCQQLERSTVLGNFVRGNGRGLYIENSGRNQFLRNEISANGVGVYLTAGSEDNTFSQNRFRGNLVQAHTGARDRNRWSEAGQGNYWSDYTGFDWDRDGVGDRPYRLQTASSVLLARHPAARMLWSSPLLALLDWWETLVLRASQGALDVSPLVDSPPELRIR